MAKSNKKSIINCKVNDTSGNVKATQHYDGKR